MGLLDSILGSALGGSEGQGGARDPKVALLIGLVTMLMSRQGGAAQGGGDGGGLLGSLGSILGGAGGGLQAAGWVASSAICSVAPRAVPGRRRRAWRPAPWADSADSADCSRCSRTQAWAMP